MEKITGVSPKINEYQSALSKARLISISENTSKNRESGSPLKKESPSISIPGKLSKS